MVDLNDLSDKARSAAMRGGTAGWGEVADSRGNMRYIEKVGAYRRKRCSCGCGQRGTHYGACNGIVMTSPRCELSARRWAKTGE